MKTKDDIISEVCGKLDKEREKSRYLQAVAKEIKKQIQEIENGDRPYTGFDTELLDAAIDTFEAI